MAKHAWFQVRKDPSVGYRIQENVGGRWVTRGTSSDRIKANQSAGIRSSERMIKTRGRKDG